MNALLLLHLWTFIFLFVTTKPSYGGGPAGLLRSCVGGSNHGFICTNDQQCLSGVCHTEPLMCNDGLNIGNVCVTDAECAGGACVNVGRFREPLPRICRSGPRKGAGCRQDRDCDNTPCILDLRKPGTVKGTLTLIVDDDQIFEPLGSSQPCAPPFPDRATTLLLEVRKNGRRHLLSQAFRCLLPSSNAGNALWTETALNAAVDDASILNSLLFRSMEQRDGFGNLGQALRDIFGSTGRPVILSTQKAVDFAKYANRENDDLASVIRVDVTIGFVP